MLLVLMVHGLWQLPGLAPLPTNVSQSPLEMREAAKESFLYWHELRALFALHSALGTELLKPLKFS